MKYGVVRMLCVFVLSFAALNAGSTDRWIDGEVISGQMDTLKAVLYASTDGEVRMGLIMPSEDCVTFNENVLDAPVMIINATFVKMSAQCVGVNSRMDFPRTNAGLQYMINEFKVNNQVIMQQDGYIFSFSAVGFQKEYNKEVEKSALERNAL